MKSVLMVAAIAICLACGCHAANYTQQGAGLGALTGGLTGAAIGRHNGDTAVGALVGAAAGTLAGAAIGDSIDYEAARSQAIIEERLGRRLAGAVSIDDAIAMSSAGLSEDVISTHIRAHGVAAPPGVGDLITMRDAGVSDGVIKTMQSTGLPPAQLAAPQGSVIIEEHHYIAPAPPPFHRHHHHGWPRHGRGFHWGVGFGH